MLSPSRPPSAYWPSALFISQYGVVARDRRGVIVDEPVRDVRLRLVHHRHDEPPARRGDSRHRHRDRRAARGVRQPPKTRSAASTARAGLDVADDDRRQLGRREPLRVQRPKLLARSVVSTVSIVPFRAAGRRDAPRRRASPSAPSTARTAGLSSSWRMAVITSPLRVASSVSGTLGAITMSPSSAEHGFEVLGETGARRPRSGGG